MNERRSRTQRSVFLVSLALSMGLCMILVPREPSLAMTVLVGVGIIAALGLFVPVRLGGLLLALGVLNAVTVLPELALRLGGFEYVSGIQFGHPEPELFWHMEPDDELFWTLPVDEPGVNSLGFLGVEPREPKPAGTARLMFLGDSCTQQGHPESWAELTVLLLARGGMSVDGVNLSMSGYSTHQGRVLAERYGERLEPDVVFVYYGWNDHWLAYGAIDAEKQGGLRNEQLYRRSRLLQALRRTAVSTGALGKPTPLGRPRVPTDAYVENLRAIAAPFGALGAPIVLVTAPTSHGALGVPDYLVDEQFAESKEAVLERHREYNELARAAAELPGVHVLDAAAIFEAEVDPDTAFLEDGIHLTEAGRLELATRAVDFLLSEGLIPGPPR